MKEDSHTGRMKPGAPIVKVWIPRAQQREPTKHITVTVSYGTN
jgi:hypothetical protein